MPELVDRLMGSTAGSPGGSTPPNRPAGEGSSPSQSAPGAEKPGSGGVQERINELTRQRKEAQERERLQAQENQDLRERLSRLEGQVSSKSQEGQRGIPSSYAELTDTELHEAYKNAFESQSANTAYLAQQEMMRRAAEKSAAQALEKGHTQLRADQYRSSVHQRILQEFGEDASNPESSLYQRAMQYAQAVTQQHGRDAFDKNPDLGYQVYLQAERDLSRGLKDEMATLRQEMERLKRQQSLETGASAAARISNESAEALQRRDIKGAIRNLGVVRSFSQGE